jgi:zona occludens toxin (predicted ATPase)
MIVVAVLLALWIFVVWWQDKRTYDLHVMQGESDAKSKALEADEKDPATKTYGDTK